MALAGNGYALHHPSLELWTGTNSVSSVQISNITDQVNGWGLGAQPALMELTMSMGGYEPGTILAAGNSWSDNGTRIDVYASLDKGVSWKFVSQVAEGGAPNTTNGADPIWEPYLMYDCYYLFCSQMSLWLTVYCLQGVRWPGCMLLF